MAHIKASAGEIQGILTCFVNTNYMKNMLKLSRDINNEVKKSFFPIEIGFVENESDINQIIDLSMSHFGEYFSSIEECKMYYSSMVDYSISIKASIGNKIIGFYLLGDSDMLHAISQENLGETDKEQKILDLQKSLIGKVGIHGVSLLVDPKYRKFGVATAMIEKSKNYPIDYIWGYAYKSLNNLDFWTKKQKREVAFQDKNFNWTIWRKEN